MLPKPMVLELAECDTLEVEKHVPPVGINFEQQLTSMDPEESVCAPPFCSKIAIKILQRIVAIR